eukprot:2805913-Amphidinium_carterae.1
MNVNVLDDLMHRVELAGDLPQIIAGDFQHEIPSLGQLNGLWAKGWVSVMDRHVGVPTNRAAKGENAAIDGLLLSPHLAMRVSHSAVTDWGVFSTHSVLRVDLQFDRVVVEGLRVVPHAHVNLQSVGKCAQQIAGASAHDWWA